jgi:hypothetical protein
MINMTELLVQNDIMSYLESILLPTPKVGMSNVILNKFLF